MKKTLTLLFALVFLPGCSDSDDPENNSQIRFLNALPGTANSRIVLGLDLDDPEVDEELAFGELTEYRSFEEETFDFRIFREGSPVLNVKKSYSQSRTKLKTQKVEPFVCEL